MRDPRPAEREVLWLKLLAILEEASWTIVRTSLSPTVRDAHDFGCLLYDVSGRLVAQNTTVAAKLGVYHTLLDKVYRYYPRSVMAPGDVFICNDPWLTEGHLYDVSVLMPVFRADRVVAFVECIAHLADIGGCLSTSVTDLYGEGLQIPVCRLIARGQENAEIVRFIEENVRVPGMVMGDLRALVSCLFAIRDKCDHVLQDHGLDDFDELFEQILSRTEAAMRAGIRSNLRAGSYVAEIIGDGHTEEGIVVRVKATVVGDSVELDFSGSSPQAAIGINACANYAYAWSVFAIKTLAEVAIPNNAGCFGPIRFVAPEGTVVNPVRPAPVRNRAASAHFVPQVIYSALSQATKSRTMAESGSPLWVHRITGRDERGEPVAGMIMYNGGMGARTGWDGPSATPFPSNAGNMPVEVLENWFPITVEEKGLIEDSGGAGEYRGGCGQRVIFRVRSGASLQVLFMHERTRRAARGVLGGGAGRVGLGRLNGRPLPSHGDMQLRGGDRVELETPGGGGVGAPALRSRELVASDVRDGLVSPSSASVDYVVPGIDAEVTRFATALTP